jgi:hypothetical protein
MKRVALIFAIAILAAVGAFAQTPTYRYANAIVLAWDPPTTLENGDPIPVGDSISYEILVAAPGEKPGEVRATVTDSQEAVSFASEGEYSVGVRAVRIVASTGDRLESPINWLDVGEGNQDGVPVIVRVFFPPGSAGALRLQ